MPELKEAHPADYCNWVTQWYSTIKDALTEKPALSDLTDVEANVKNPAKNEHTPADIEALKRGAIHHVMPQSREVFPMPAMAISEAIDYLASRGLIGGKHV